MRPLMLPVLFLAALSTAAQKGLDLRAESDANTVMVRGYAGVDAMEPALQATWRLPADQPGAFSYQRLTAPATGHALMLRPLLLAAIEQYLDQRIHFSKGGVSADADDEHLMMDLNAMVAGAAHEFGADGNFSGFS
ncbi:MAG TPA: hypothetical protein PL002_17080, partial [Flavobacteriales bacterium]|nr:hypothetical protein [Flavobacteriales bacterium]